MGCSVEELAAATVGEAFEEADLDHDGNLSFEEFQRWYSASADEGIAQQVDANVQAASKKMSLGQLRDLTGLGTMTATAVMEKFAEVTGEDGTVGREEFELVFEELAAARAVPLTDDEEDGLRVILGGLYDMFDADGDGTVDFTELSCGLMALCGGDRDEKAAAAFALYDYNGDGVISKDEMERYLTSVFRVMYHAEEGTEEAMGCSAEELAGATADEAFEEADLDHDGNLTFEEADLD